MLNLRAYAAIIVFSLLPTLSRADDPMPTVTQPDASTSFTIGVADFTGGETERGRFLAETLLTDMSQSGKLQLVERNEIKHALDELKLQSTGLFDPSQIKQLGKLVRADHLIVGSYLENGDQMIVNARLLDVETGRVAPGGGANVVGPRKDLLGLVHRLAHLLHRRITGEDFVLEGETPQPLEALDDLLPHAKLASDKSDSSPTAPGDQAQSPAVDKPFRKDYPGRKSTSGSTGSGYRIQEKEDESGWYTPASDSSTARTASTAPNPDPLVTEGELQQALSAIYSPTFFYSFSYNEQIAPYAVGGGQPVGNYGSISNLRNRRTNDGFNYGQRSTRQNFDPPFGAHPPANTYNPPSGGIYMPPSGGAHPPPPRTYRWFSDERSRRGRREE